MPVSTRQATPGPSTLGPTALQPSNQSKNTKKRANSETQEDGREVKKKIKIGTEAPPHATNGKDKKKKKRKKKRRASVVKTDPETEERARSTRRSAPLSSRGQVVTTSGDSGPTSRAANHVKADEIDEEPVLSSSDKGKGKASSESPSRRAAKSPSTQPIASGSGSTPDASPTESTPQDSEIARLKEQLAVQTKLLERHESHLGHHHQSLTCQICLELMYKPYALSPCGHITCYGCLVRWFTAPLNPVVAAPDMNAVEPAPQVPDTIETILSSATARNGSYIRRRKKCPICRAVVVERPVEMWGIKDMVAALVRSELVDIPSAPGGPPAGEEVANADPWRNVFRRAGAAAHGWHAVPFFPFAAPAPREQNDADREQMGWYDAEDGGIHRCIDCYHEIWDGVCSGCRREYPGHGLHNDDDDDDDDGEEIPEFLPYHHGMDIFGDDDDDESDENGDDDDWGYGYHIHDPSEDEYDEEDDDVQDPQANLPQFVPVGPAGWQRVRGEPEFVEVDTEGEDEEDEESNYGGSFIDDGHDDGDGDDDGENEDDDGENEDDDDDDDDEVEFVDPPTLRAVLAAERRRREERRRRIQAELAEDDDDDDDDDDAGALFRPTHDAGLRFEDESDENSADEQYQRALSRRIQSRHIVDETDSDGAGSQVNDEDDDDDDDEDMDPPIRYTRSRTFPVVDWHEDEQDDDDDDDDGGGWW